jgi:anti-sigma factor RsiW
VLDEALPALPARRRPWRRVAAIVAALALGGAGGWLLRDAFAPLPPAPPAPQLAAPTPAPELPAPAAGAPVYVDQATAAHRVYSAENRHAVEVPADEETHLAYWLSNRLGAQVKAPKLYGAGFKLMGGRLLPAAGGGVAAQFMYEDKAGRRVTLYLKRPDPAARGPAFEFGSAADGVGVFWWSDERFAYALAAALPREELLPVAKLVHDQLEKKTP